MFYITPDTYDKYSRKWIKLIHAMGFDSGMMKFFMEPEDYENDFGEKMETLLEQSKIKFDIETVDGYKVYTRLKR